MLCTEVDYLLFITEALYVQYFINPYIFILLDI